MLVPEELEFDTESRPELNENSVSSIFLWLPLKKHFQWRTGVSIPVALECESSALPFELVPLDVLGKIKARYIDDTELKSQKGVSTEGKAC